MIDPVGAGDAVLSIASLTSYVDNFGDFTLFAGSISGMIGTSIRGNSSSVGKDQLIKNMKGFIQSFRYMGHTRKILSSEKNSYHSNFFLALN